MEIPDKNRIESLDIVRGFALLGIFLINLNYFSTPSVERYHPSVTGDFGGLDQWIWVGEYALVKQRFMTIFSVLFGAGIWLMAAKVKQRGQNPTGLHLRRMAGLIVIGCIHAYLIWDGDILVSYAFCGILVFLLRNLSLKWLWAIGSLMVLASFWETALRFISPAEISEDYLLWWNPSLEDQAFAKAAHEGSWLDEFPARASVAFERQTIDWLYFTLWRVGGLMVLGMAMMKNGFLAGKMDKKVYRKTALLFGLPGLVLSFWGAFTFMAKDYDLAFFMEELTLSFWLGSLLLAFGYISLVILWAKSSWFKGLKKRFAELGRLSLTNYLMQSVIGTLLFFGYGLGWYGEVSRVGLVGIALAVWSLQFTFSWWWLQRYRFGPLEGLWRSLTYWKWPQWRKK